MEANDAKLLSEFLGNVGPQYVIPVYQRHYTWDSKDVLRLLFDVKKVLEGKAKSHFIGTIVFVRKGEANWHEREIVDGQQRITTVFLSLYALRDLALDSGDLDEASTTEDLYLLNNVPTKYTQFKYKLKPNVGDNNTFQCLITRNYDGLKTNQSALYGNYQTIYKELSDWKRSGYSFEDIRNAFDGLKIVWIALEKGEDAQQIFESINSTGEPLTSADLIRNFLLMNKDDDEQTNIYNMYWKIIERNVFPLYETTSRKKVSKKIEEFFRFYLSSKLFSLVNIDQVYSQFKDSWSEWIKSNSEQALLNELVTYSKYWNLLFNDNDIKDETSEPIKTLRRIESNMPTPFLFGVLQFYDHKIISIKAVAESISLVNIYLIRRHMDGQDTSSITRMFPTLLGLVTDKAHSIGFDHFIEIVKYYLVNTHVSDAMFMPDDGQLFSHLCTCNAYSLSQTKTFFDIIESKTVSGSQSSTGAVNPIPINISALTIEHIMPQEATSYWLEKVDNKDNYSKIVNLLGNLTLADKKTNSKMSNKDFSFKKAALKNVGRINMNNEIIAKQEWNEQEILDRTKRLIEAFISLFPYYSSNLSFIDEKKSTYSIYLNYGSLKASGIIDKDYEVTLLPGSMVRKCDNRKTRLAKRLTREIESGNIVEEADHFVISQPLLFSSISNATNFIYGGSNNGWSYWTDENGTIINESIRNCNQ